MRTLSILLIALAAPAATAGTVLTYKYSGDTSGTAVLVMEIQDGWISLKQLEYGEWEVFDPAGPVIREMRAADRVYRELDGDDGYTYADELAPRTEPEWLGEMSRDGYECVMYRQDENGSNSMVCLADAAALGIPAEDVAALQAYAKLIRKLTDLHVYDSAAPLPPGTTGDVAVANLTYDLIKVEQRDVPREHFETPPDYKPYEPPKVYGG